MSWTGIIGEMIYIMNSKSKVTRFQAFFEKKSPKVRALAFHLLKSEEDAKDVTQDIFVKLWENPDLWMNCERMSNYLYTVERNYIYNYLKHKAVTSDYLEIAAERMKVAEQELLQPHDEYCFHEVELLLQMALERMPEQRRRIFSMSREEEISFQEIAKRLNISVRTVEYHVYRALQDIKKSIMYQ